MTAAPHGSAPEGSRKLAFLVTMGCPKNRADSDSFTGVLEAAGWEMTSLLEGAELLLLNTCAFIAPAVEESMDAVREALEWKSAAEGRKLVLAGCLPGRFPDDGSGGLEDFDLVIGPADFPALASFLSVEASGAAPAGEGINRYLRISDGCSNHCNYCTIPLIRGEHAPRPAGEIIADCALLVGQGAREVGIVGQDTGAWRSGERGVPWLLSELAGIHPDVWFRLYYVHPSHFPEGLLEVFSSHPNVVPYIELPVQHASDRVLSAMGRPYRRRDLEGLFGMLDGWSGPTAVRTTMIVGYPGERDEDFRQLMDFLGGHSCLRTICAFPYWPEEGTPQFEASGTSGMPGPAVVQSRLAAIGDAGEMCRGSWAGRLEGSIIDVLADSASAGHSMYDAPDVDGVCIFSQKVTSGTVVRCRVDECIGPDMLVTPAADPPGVADETVESYL